MSRGIKGTKSPHGTHGRYSNHGCRCDLCKQAIRDYRAELRVRKGLPPQEPRRAAEHGTHGRYSNHGCRCDACTKANRDDCREYDYRTGRRRPMAEHLAEIKAKAAENHATEGTYKRCKCDACRAAATAARRSRRARRAVSAVA